MARKYSVKLSDTVHRMITIYFVLGLWTTQSGHRTISVSQLFYFVSFCLFGVSVIIEACTTENNDDCIFLVVTNLICLVQVGRLYNIIWKQNRILDLIRTASANGTDDYDTFCIVSAKLNKLMSLATYFIFATLFLLVVVVGLPFIKKELIFDIAFPLDYKNSESGFYVAYTFVAGIFLLSITCILFASMLWFIMLNFVVKYEILGNDFKNLGVSGTEEDEQKNTQTLYLQHLVESIKSLENINGLLEDFSSNFSYLFLLQIVTSSICICGGVYTLAFSSHANLVQDGFYFTVLFYCFFDTFTLLYLGNEIMLASDRLSYCLFESEWMEQTQSCKKYFLIVVERLKQPQQLVVGKLFPMNLRTFTAIVNRAYSLFNVLQNFRE
ncbi:odorant receptor 94b-like [Bradysia coprophila]|uniref:odorant receptor 94b-like n=1 Tax=Bradysia coprophila TaxID=38358 RepID=UPI00187DA50F|nr:odorant receptor 94b-like [Bradysia coprophila]XP_037039265.1 odorant receptor 94b-like [Bradysia coprophila]